ncbi:MAG: hypothetical protein GY736_18360, partial [Sphingomonas sp.]|uniref:hypothetical protein n=1 Tax=Sphingomonas sp. TaxID=28214 RepID=UPI002589FD56
MRQILITLGVGAIGAVVLALLASPERLADHWGREWDGLPDAEIPARMRQLAELGDDGMAAVAEALGSERLTVAEAAEATLREQLDEWRELHVRQSAPKVSHLVRCLAKQSPDYGPKARRMAADLATRALLWPVDSGGPDRDRLVRDCDTLMRAAANDVPPMVAQSDFDSRHNATVASRPPVGEPPAVGQRRFAPTNTDVIGRESPAPHPGGGLPI